MALAEAWETLRAPGITVDTPGCCQIHAMAACAGVTSDRPADETREENYRAASTPVA